MQNRKRKWICGDGILGKRPITSRDSNKRCKILEGIIIIEIEFADKRDAEILYTSLLPEAKNPPTYRSISRISLDNKKLKIEISSKDLVSLRAAINSYFRWLYAIVMGLKVIRSVRR